ncbi:MAG: CoA transferase [Deltaproteobacteria bacterium]|nr:CoA transferase [Deltaproteobacteria bacterium]
MHPLEGLRVVDLTTMINGPVAAMLLSDMGAEVIKIEPPDGDPWRPMLGGFLAYNRGKRAISLNMKKEAGKRIALQLIAKADILVENARWGVWHRLGLDYESVAKINPDLVYLTVTGHGTSGPFIQRPGYDPLLQARSGHMVGQGGIDQAPVFHLIALNDVASPMLGAYGVALALLQGLRTGKGQHVVMSLTNASVCLQAMEFLSHPGLKPVNKGGERLIGLNALTRHYQTSDERWLMLYCPKEHHWQGLCRSLWENLYSDPRFTTPEKRAENDKALAGYLIKAFAEKPAEYWLEVLSRADVPVSLGLINEELLEDPHCLENGFFEDRDHPLLGRVRHHGITPRFSDMSGIIRRTGPLLGQHTSEVLAELGYTREEIDQLVEDKVAFLTEEIP